MSSEADTRVVLAAIAALSGKPLTEVTILFRSAAVPASAMAARNLTEQALQALIRRIHLAPIPVESKAPIIEDLRNRLSNPPQLTQAELAAWNVLTQDLPPAITQIDRDPVVLPDMPASQHAAWRTILDLDQHLQAHWTLVGGQMVTFLCAEYSYTGHCPTVDADIVLDVWITRQALKDASRLLDQSGFVEDPTRDGYGYRYRRGNAAIDLLLPQGLSGQRRVPTTTTGRPGLEVPGANQALIRAERVPAQLDDRLGYVPGRTCSVPSWPRPRRPR